MASALATAAGAANACGLEDPNSIGVRRGALSLAYPEVLHVGTAVWQAQLAGRLPRDPLASRDDLTPEGRAALRLMRANALLAELALRMHGAAGTQPKPSLAIVLLGPVLWTRFDASSGSVRPNVHVPGPETDDVVVVTESAVLEAINRGALGFDAALALGVVRLYGAAERVAAAREWLAQVAPG